ncbi:MAG: UDP-N-acetylgalactosamine-undecaprenyl-phosphate N-acetylgalactosaminephosphotransferase [candidate division TA06 bacterium ADurb.Bin131]|uniref:UDP-N-acetylgalactosamine-undecaprenyl-phosphate N-acetylgalactosaminephosphotransferase n=1 Tax=candidate division TA06 bacterium ADurb.Bin131 TaxID=1852827 RepID=A0A1V6CFA6_UNCT6|nr:MAG: UDP-N-acetylgalactosamine-undecaprenyl-phosphate N-acetylgalactosaminephosphotransferase [candidate division TA06 bacterium ADurb.Bin131]
MLKHIPKKKFLLLTGDALLIYFACIIAPAIRFQILVFEPLASWDETLTVMFSYLICFYIADFYNFNVNFSGVRFYFKFLTTMVVSTAVVLILFFIFPKLELSRGVFIVNDISIAILIFLWRFVFEKVFKRHVPARQKNFLIVGAGKSGNSVYKILKNDSSCNVVGFIDDDPSRQLQHNSGMILGNHTVLEHIVKNKRVDHMVVAIKNLKNADLLKKILSCKMSGVIVYDVPSFYEEVLGRIQVEHLSDLWILNMPIYGVKKSMYNRNVKRLISILFALFFLTITFPIFLFTMIAIKFDSKGPVFYRQKRVGLNGYRFEVFKFRTMKVGTENDRAFAGKKNDPRITRVGRILRLARIDEIPQMWNVLKGEMGLIGPRALMVEEVEEFEKKVPYFSIRHSVKPGITGWAQVNYPHGTTVEDALEKLKYDLFYIKNLSPFLDFHILLRTVRVVLFGKGAR